MIDIKLGRDDVERILKEVRQLTGSEVLVGIPGTNDPRPLVNGKPSPGNAMLGYVHQHGDPAKNLPARPWLSDGINAAQPQVTQILSTGVERALAGEVGAANDALEAAGLVAASVIRATMVAGQFTPLSPYTLRMRRKIGFKGTKPLNHTRELGNSITYVVRARRSRTP